MFIFNATIFMNTEKLIYANTESSSDMLYFAKMNIPDPVFAFTFKGKKFAILSPLEIGRARKESDFDEILPSRSNSQIADLIDALNALGISEVEVPRSFPSFEFVKLSGAGLKIKVADGDFFPGRRQKTERETAEIKRANFAAAQSFARVREILRESEAGGEFLKWRGKFLTSEILKYEIEAVCLKNGAESKYTIAACGNQACDPHCEGFGKIRKNSLAVFDIFPRMKSSGYFGDMTRTFLKGEPSEAQIKLVETVMKAQKLALEKVKAGALGCDVHKFVSGFFEKSGYKTEIANGKWRGFFHSTGHGIGLDIHEEPRLGLSKNVLRENEVVTVEPGLYYEGLGACRIEDNCRVLKNSRELLSNFDYDWVVK